MRWTVFILIVGIQMTYAANETQIFTVTNDTPYYPFRSQDEVKPAGTFHKGDKVRIRQVRDDFRFVEDLRRMKKGWVNVKFLAPDNNPAVEASGGDQSDVVDRNMNVSTNRIGIETLRQFNDGNTNIATSPEGISRNLYLLTMRSKDNNPTIEEIRQVIGKPEDESFFKLSDSKQMTAASCLFKVPSIRLNGSVTREYEKLGVEIASFDNNSPEKINAWIAKNTGEKIKQLYSRNEWPQDIQLLLVSTSQFIARWKNKFTKTPDFKFFLKNNDGTDKKKISVSGLTYEGSLGFHEGEDFKLVQIPYDGDQFVAFAVQPDSVQRFLKEVEPQSVSNWFDLLKEQELEFYMPEFGVDSQHALERVVDSLGAHQAFTDKADFSNLTPDELLSKVVFS